MILNIFQKETLNKEDPSKSYSMVECNGKRYCLSSIPSKTDCVVIDALKEIEGQLNLQYLSSDISNLRIHIQIIYQCIKMDFDLQMQVRTRVRNVNEVCIETATTVKYCAYNSEEALKCLQKAYQYLDEDSEDQALEFFLNLQEVSKNMKNGASKLSKRCKEESQHIKQVGDAALQKKAYVKRQQESNKDRIEKLEKLKAQTKIDIKEAKSESQGAQSCLLSDQNKETEILSKIRKMEEDDYIRSQQNKMKIKRELKSSCDNSKEDAQKQYDRSKVKNEKEWSNQLQANYKIFESAVTDANAEYKDALVNNESDLKENQRLNEQWLREEQAKNQKIYSEAINRQYNLWDDKISEAERDYNEEIHRIECSARNELNANIEIYKTKLKENRENLDIILSKNTAEYQIGRNRLWYFQSEDDLRCSKEKNDAIAQEEKTSADNEARQYKITKDNVIQVKEEREKSKANKEKEEKIKHYCKEKDKIKEHALQVESIANNEANKIKAAKDEKAEENRQYADSEAQYEKETKVSNAQQEKERNDKQAFAKKDKLDKIAESSKNDQIQTIENDYQGKLKRLDEKHGTYFVLDTYKIQLENIKERERQGQKVLDESKKKEQNFEKVMYEIHNELSKCWRSDKDSEHTVESLYKTISALNEIESTMINIWRFWGEIEQLCESVTGCSTNRQIDMLKDMEPNKRKMTLKSSTFKLSVLICRGKFVALKDVCAKASNTISSVVDKAQMYLVENTDDN